MWQSVVNGQALTFHLAGINNQNFIMQDEQTGSWWQQITGQAIQGPLKGDKLGDVFSEEVSFTIWKRENPNGRVLRPDPEVLAAGKYESSDWESKVAKMPVRIAAPVDNAIEPRTLVVGIDINGESKAYPMSAIEKQNPIIDTIGGEDIVIILSDDSRSVRAFQRAIAGQSREFFANPESHLIVDAETGSTWDFSGRAVSGDLLGKQLDPVRAQKDYWFDWKTYHPETRLYLLGR